MFRFSSEYKHDVSGDRLSKSWRYRIAYQSGNLLPVAHKLKLIWESLKSRALSKRDVPDLPRMAKFSPGEGVKSSCDRSSRRVRIESSVYVAVPDGLRTILVAVHSKVLG